MRFDPDYLSSLGLCLIAIALNLGKLKIEAFFNNQMITYAIKLVYVVAVVPY